MIDVNKIKCSIVSAEKTQINVVKRLGITPKTFSIKLKKGVFRSDEIEVMIDYLSTEADLFIFLRKKQSNKLRIKGTNELKERREKMKPNSILNTNQYTKVVIKREDDDTLVAVITDDKEPVPEYVAVCTPNYN